jgi:hypothetical protein
MFGWGRPKSNRPSSDLTPDAMRDAIVRYGSIMERHGTAVLDVSLLPLPKPQMKQAFRIAWGDADTFMKNAIEEAYVFLACFQEGVGDKPIDCRLPSGTVPEKDMAVLEPWLRWSKTVQSEMEMLATELREFTGRPEPDLDDAGHAFASRGNKCIRDDDYAGATKWYLLAAGEGNIQAQSQLGRLYSIGEGVPVDYAEAVKWSRLAAEQGDTEAQAHLGGLYIKGQGVPVDYVEAVKWCRKAAYKGHATAQMLLGGMYHNGDGVKRDLVRSYMLFTLAASGFAAAKSDNVNKTTSLRDIVAAKMTPEEIAKAQDRARNWRPEVKPSGN